ncbi:MAG: DUF4249 domain-containing protein [Saprospiraceae bacterium]|nr:DUF4249 domain-containing protein [Saprospiraceae bacterium]
MKKLTYWHLAVLLVFIKIGCQYPVDKSILPTLKQFIVIDAELTETYGKVNVTYSLTNVASNGGYQFPTAPKATAYVLDSRGNKFIFTKTDGTQNAGFQGIVGETYRLFVEVDGKKYESKPETMRACPALDSLSTPYRRENFRAESDLYYDGFDVYANLTDEANKENYYQWDWIHYERAPYCDNRFVSGDGRAVLIPCFPNDCWNIIYNSKTIVLSDKLRDGQPIAHRVVRIPYATPPNRYYIKVTQRAITPSVFAYLQSLETQTQNTGTLFDVPAQTRFSPNVYNVNNPEEQILGVFSVFSFRYKIAVIDMVQKIDGAKPKVFLESTPYTSNIFLNAPCVESALRTKIRPENWVD